MQMLHCHPPDRCRRCWAGGTHPDSVLDSPVKIPRWVLDTVEAGAGGAPNTHATRTHCRCQVDGARVGVIQHNLGALHARHVTGCAVAPRYIFGPRKGRHLSPAGHGRHAVACGEHAYGKQSSTHNTQVYHNQPTCSQTLYRQSATCLVQLSSCQSKLCHLSPKLVQRSSCQSNLWPKIRRRAISWTYMASFATCHTLPSSEKACIA